MFGIRARTVDSFQGSEADIVIVSLVRANEGRRIGFLKVSVFTLYIYSYTVRSMHCCALRRCLAELQRNRVLAVVQIVIKAVVAVTYALIHTVIAANHCIPLASSVRYNYFTQIRLYWAVVFMHAHTDHC
jgi:AAA domain